MKSAPGTEPVIMIIASLSDSARYEMLNPCSGELSILSGRLLRQPWKLAAMSWRKTP
ncbi:hypothetical protein M5E88_16760 [Akkermansia muciniphila]|nr:hypothetical protein M5E88_16760 [Akkermansia muciniphila]